MYLSSDMLPEPQAIKKLLAQGKTTLGVNISTLKLNSR